MSRDDPVDWETMEATEPQAGEQLDRILARYARVRLEPSPAETRRARAAVMETVWRSRLEAEAAGRRWRLPFTGWSARRLTLAATAAVFAGLLVGSSVFAASRAGGPLYGARISFEQATLPADPAARLQAQIANAYARLADARDAEARGDEGALAAALRAYAADATTLASTTGASATQALAAVQQHRDVLLSLAAGIPTVAVRGLDQALASSDHAIQQLTDAAGHGPQPGNGNGNGNSNGNGNGNSNGNGNGAATPPPSVAPAATSKPQHSDSPAATPKPAATAKPRHTPKPAPSADPGGAPASPPGAP